MPTWYLVTGASKDSSQTSSTITVIADNVKYMPIKSGTSDYNSTSLLSKTNVFTFRKGNYGSYGFTYSGLFSGSSTSTYSCMAICSSSSSYKQGNITQFLVRDDSALFSHLSTYYINKVVANTLSGKYKITSLASTYNYTNTNYLVDRYYTNYYARLWLPLFDVKLNGIEYDYIACRCTATYGYQSLASFSDAQISNIYGCKKGETSLTKLTLSAGDIIDLQGDDIPVNTFWYNLLSAQQRVWEYTDTIYNYSGTSVVSLLEQTPPVNSIDVSVAGDTATVTYHYIDNTTKAVEIDIPRIEYRTFAGLSYKPYTQIATIPPDGNVHEIAVENSTKFYLSYGRVNRPITEPFDMNLYQSTAEPNRVDKTNHLTSMGVLSGVLRDYTSITDLSIRVQMEAVPQFNYIFIESFNRYYFVTDIASVKENMWEISASCDVLMTYKDALYNCAAFIDRNEIDYNRMIVDNKTPLQQGQNVTTHFISNNLFSGAGTYVIQGINLGVEEDE